MNNSLKVLLSEIVDYAGLFPPSQVSMATAVQNFDSYLKSENAWMLGRFVVPVNRLDEFSDSAEKYLDGENIWRLSILASSNLAETLDEIESFNQTNEGKAKIDMLEIRVETAEEIHQAARLIPAEIKAYFEIPQSEIMTDFMTALVLTKQRAKIRTGGITQDAFPSSDAIIRFIRVCLAANVPFKATAGLHHPIRCAKPLTYEANAPVGTMHGFLNLFLTACLLRQNLNNPDAYRLMLENDSRNLVFHDDEIHWTNQLISTNTIALTRAKNAISFGSCSFLEPIEDLISLNIYQ